MKVKKALCFCIGMLLLFSGCGSKGSAGQTQEKKTQEQIPRLSGRTQRKQKFFILIRKRHFWISKKLCRN